jgi:hypothetical protein
MSGFVPATNIPLSRMTVARLGNLGYQLDRDSAER